MHLTTHTFMTTDGVMQAPGGADEDGEDGFRYGGWIVPLFNEDVGRVVDEWFSKVEAFLLGRKTWQTFKAFWPQVDPAADPVAGKLNSLPKYVVSATLSDLEADWAGSRILRGDFVSQIRNLKKQPGGELQVHGSARLLQALHEAGLVDVYRVIQFPVVLGAGKRLFAAGCAASGFDVSEARVLSGGILAYELYPKPLPEAPGSYNVVDGKEVIVP